MSQKAWMQAYSKGSKSLQARLAKIHANNPEFREFVKKHGFGGNLSKKQSELQKKGSVQTVKPVTDPHPERSGLDREAMIKAAAEKIKSRRQAHANRVAFGGELGGGFQMPMGGFRRYSEEVSLDEASIADKIRAHPAVEYYGGADDSHFINLKKGWHMGDGQRSFGNRNVRDAWHDLKRVVKFKPGEAKEYGLDETVAANFRKVIPGLGRSQAFNRAKDLDNELTAGIQKKEFTRNERMRRAKHIERFARIASGGKAFNKEEVLDTHVVDGYKHILNKDGEKQYSHVMEPVRGKGRQVVVGGKSAVASSWEDSTGKKMEESKINEEVPYKDAVYTMSRGGWVVKRRGKVISAILPTEDHAKRFIDKTKKTLTHKLTNIIRTKAKEIAHGMGRTSLATESAANRRRVRSWDSAIMPELKPLRVAPKKKEPPFTPDKPKKNLGIVVGKNDPGYSKARHLARLGLKKAMERERINKTVDYISNPKYSVLDKNKINSLLKGK